MSWMKQPQGGPAPPQGPDRPPYAAPHPQGYVNQQGNYPNYQGTGVNSHQQQFWQMPPPQQTPQQLPQQPQYNQQYGQVYQQDYPSNANQLYQPHAQYNQNYNHFSNPQQGYQQYSSQPVQQNYTHKPNTDSWEDNWDWGWDEATKQAHKAQNMPAEQLAPQQQVFNNANPIEESFVTTDSWNWAVEEKKDLKEPVLPNVGNKELVMVPTTDPVAENNTPLVSTTHSSSNDVTKQTEEVKTLSDRDVKERLPNLALGKRFHLENLTPQWSIESQMSQESSDGPQTHSEGTYRSENQSRNSSKSSPGLNTDNSNFNYSQPGLDEYPQNSEWSRSNEATLADSIQTSSRRESHDELSNSMQEMSIGNYEYSTAESLQESRIIQENTSVIQPPPSMTPASFPHPVSDSHPPPVMSVHLPPPSSVIPRPPSSSGSLPRPASSSGLLPPPPTSSGILPRPPSTTNTSLPPPTSTAILPPPPLSSASVPLPNFPPQSSSNNPFKHAGAFSHKTTVKSATPMQFPPPLPNSNLASPAAVNKVAQDRVAVGFEANLETTPDNSERPDQLQVSAFRPVPVSQQVPDNLEVAPQNDRNEYLQTAHLSSSDFGENTDFSRNIPPPGLRRMVVGQHENEYNQNLNMSGDELPPGLARMVPGQQTEAENAYNQPNEDYMDRHIDGQPTDNSGRPYRQADGQQTPNNYTPPPTSRGNERRPIGLDRMVPGEPSNDSYSQYQGPNYPNNEQRVVTGEDHDFTLSIDAGPSDVREQNVDGSDYSEQAPRNPARNVIGAREVNDVAPDFGAPPEEQQREVIMEGENLQDLSAISSSELTFSREQIMDGADITITDVGNDRKTDASDSIDHPVTSSRRQSINCINRSEEESERDRMFKASPRRDRDKHRSSRDRDRDREREKDKDRERDKEGRYSRGDRKYDRDERRSGRDGRRSEKDRREKDRRDKDGELDSRTRSHRRSTRAPRYETEDTDYYSDKERDSRHKREGSYTSSKPPRSDYKERRQYEDDRDYYKRYPTESRRRYDDEWDGESHRRSKRERERERYERKYRDIDPNLKYGNLRKEREDDKRRVVTFSTDAKSIDNCKREGATYSPARTADEDGEPRRRTRTDAYYDGYGGEAYGDPYALQRQQYQYYEHLRLTDPAAYMLVYKQLLAGQPPPPPPPHYHNKMHQLYGEGYSGVGYARVGGGEERGSVHSGRSSATGLKGTDTYYMGYRLEGSSLRDAPSLRTDVSDRDLNTDASLNLHLEESTVRSERMTPLRFSTAHIKASIGSREVVLVRGSYPVDGRPATVQLVSLAAALRRDPQAAELRAFPGPLLTGVTHKKSVIEYCMWRARGGAAEGEGQGQGEVETCDVIGHGLLWDLLALMLRQNGVVVGSDIAELLMKNTREHEYKPSVAKQLPHNQSRRESSASGEIREEEARSSSPDQPSVSTSDITQTESVRSPPQAGGGSGGGVSEVEGDALDKLREYLLYGNRKEAIEWAMSRNLWGHALQLAAHGDRRTRAAVAQRFLSALPPADPLHTLYCTLAAAAPPAATMVTDARWGDWRPHAAVLLANATARPDHDRRTLTQLGDSLASRGLIYSAQFCYLSAGVEFSAHPLAPLPAAAPSPCTAPPRLSLLLADPRMTTLQKFATNRAIFATEIYEYAMSLNQPDYVITELQVYKLVMACRLVDAGLYERALGYTEQAARAATRAPQHYSHSLIARLADLADRLKYHDPALQEAAGVGLGAGGAEEGGEPSPRHQQWLDDVKSVAHMLTAQVAPAPHPAPAPAPVPQAQVAPQQQYTWGEQVHQYQQPMSYVEPTEDTADYSQYYNQPVQQNVQPVAQPVGQLVGQQESEPQPYAPYDDWQRTEEHHAQAYADPYWRGDQPYGYGEAGGGEAGGEQPRPAITMPGAAPATAAAPLYGDYDDDRPHSADQTDRETDTPQSTNRKTEGKSKDEQSKGEGGKGRGGGWLGGILTKLSLRPPNQMILPDDKNPSIVWDEDTKRWRNLDGDTDESSRPPPPPPKMTDLAPTLRSPSPPLQQPADTIPPAAGMPPAPPVSNIFKMQKGRHIKKSYVDVFNPSGAPTRARPPAAEVLGPAPPAPLTAPTYFVPAPAHNDQIYHVSISSTPSPTPPPTPDSLESCQGGIYEPLGGSGDDQYRSGI